ncbi:MAG: hypothetical protein IJY08_02320 [Clostridia bacterium]|nr:hypothetical protein [Clostridia bacterium]
MRRKILSVLLACLMILSVMPMSAFAADETCSGTKHTLETHPEDGGKSRKVETVVPMCGEYGYTVYECLTCHEYFADNFEAPEDENDTHEWEKTTEPVEVSCTTNGTTAIYTCSKCGKTQGGETLVAEGHKYQETGRDGDCLTGGHIYKKCTVCGDEMETSISGTGAGHTWSENPVKIEEEPTWNKDGLAIYECTVCGTTKEVVICHEHDHELVKHAGKDATCLEDGANEYWECKVCEKLFADENATTEMKQEDIAIEALGHDTENAEVKLEMPATCKGGDGWKIVYCNRCGEEVRLTITAPGHTFKEEPIKVAPTCTAFGFDLYACTVCGFVERVNEVDPLGHTTYDDEASLNKVEVPADCENNGSIAWDCGRCGLAQSEVLNKTGHEPESVTVDATCARFGYEFTYCTNENCTLDSVSNYTSEDGIAYDVTVDGDAVCLIECKVGNTYNTENHNIENGTINAPTCDVDGDEVGYCVDCNAYETNILPALGHNFDITKGATSVIKQAQTCTDDEIITVTCANEGCSKTEDQSTENKATGHDFTGEPINHKPTCSSEGYDEYICQNDGCSETTKKNTLPKLEYKDEYTLEEAKTQHRGLSSDDTRDIFRAGDCVTVGLYKYSCSDCGKNVLVVIDGTGLGHVEPESYEGLDNEFAAVKATCTEGGATAQFTCTSCGEFVESVATDALGHDWDKVAGKDATCKEAGYKAKWTCKNCGADDEENNGAEITVDHEWETIPAVPATCEKGGVSEYKDCKNCDATEGKTTSTALNHKNKRVEDSRTVTCELYGYTHWLCPDCGLEYINGYTKALGHKWELDETNSTKPDCENDGENVYICENSTECTRGEVVPATGHINAAGEKIVDDCKDAVVDRDCVNCEKTIGRAHNDTFEVTVPATCKDYGYKLLVCRNCDYNKVTDVDDRYLADHSFGEWVTTVEATITSEGEKKRVCSVCEHEETEVIPAKTGIEYTLDIDNAVVSGAGYADSSLVKVTVSLNTAKPVEIWGVSFDLVYDKDVMTFVKAEFLSENFITSPLAHDNGGRVSIVASTANDENKKAQNVTIDGTEQLVVVYFRIENAEAVSGEFSFDDCMALNTAEEEIASEGETESIDIVKFLDVNEDDDANLADALIVYKMITGEISKDYDVTVDVNKDGTVNSQDFVYIYEYLVGIKTYEDMVGLTA